MGYCYGRSFYLRLFEEAIHRRIGSYAGILLSKTPLCKRRVHYFGNTKYSKGPGRAFGIQTAISPQIKTLVTEFGDERIFIQLRSE